MTAVLAAGCGSTTTTSDGAAGGANFTAPPLNVTFVDPTASLRGEVALGQEVYIGPFARVDGTVALGDRSNVQDNCIVEGTVVIGPEVIVAHGAHVAGPARLEGRNFVGFNSFVDGATLERGAVVGLMARVGPGVRLRSGTQVRPGRNVTTQAEADDPALGKVEPVPAPFDAFVAAVIKVNVEFARQYNALARDRGVPLGIGPNPPTTFNPLSFLPLLGGAATHDPSFRNRIVGEVRLADTLPELAPKMGFRDALRADEGHPLAMGRLGHMADEVTFHALEHTGLTIGDNCYFGRHCVVHGGPDDQTGHEGTTLGQGVRVGERAIVFRCDVGDRVVVGERALVDGGHIPAETVIGPGEIWVKGQRVGLVEW